MATTVTWSILDMKRHAATGGVVQVHWQCVATADTGETAVESGKYICEPDPTSEGFVAYDDLTESVVLDWVKESEDVDADGIEANRTARAEAQAARNSAQTTGVPWAEELVLPE
jgi:hypothetical protein